jgi:EAL and modified HD-GYP domain-containing signal transduction protein
MSDNCLVRQPVFGTSGALMGYEIRYSDSDEGQQALIQSFLSGTFDLVRGRDAAFVACGRTQLVENTFHIVDPKSAILLLPRSIDDAPEVLEAIARYRDNGGLIALDEINEAPAPSEALLPLAAWARVDVRGEDPAVIARVCDRITQANGAIKIMAHHIEELAQYEVALQVGVDGFQGQFFSSPEPVPAADLPQSTVAAMRLMGLARDPNVNDRKLEDVLETDPVLTFQLLRLVNSAAVGMRGVSSIGQAVRLIGRTAFQRWLAVAVAASRKSQTGVDQELVRQAVERGRLIEQLAGGSRDPGTLFLVGLFSLLDAVFRMSLPEILERVALSDDATAALLDRTGPYADALAFAESYELGMFESAAEVAKEMGVDPAKIGEMYTNALTWTNEALGAISEAPPAPASAGRR